MLQSHPHSAAAVTPAAVQTQEYPKPRGSEAHVEAQERFQARQPQHLDHQQGDHPTSIAATEPTSSSKYSPPFSQELDPARSDRQFSSDSRPTRRKAAPSPLQSFQTSSPSAANADSASISPTTLPFPRPPAHHPNSTRSLYYSPPANDDRPHSPRERLEALLASEGVRQGARESNKAAVTRDDGVETAIAVKAPSYAQLRNSSAPVPISRPGGVSPPNPPAAMASPAPLHRVDLRPMVRTSSIDSALSSISSQGSISHKSSQDLGTSNPNDITSLITAAGSPEAVILHLLKEKQSSAAQNAQLWKLVDKQRTMILGLNKDLERALKDKDRYRKKLREQRPSSRAESSSKVDQVPAKPSEAEPVVAAAVQPEQSPPEATAVRDVVPKSTLQEMVSGGMRDPAVIESKETMAENGESPTEVRAAPNTPTPPDSRENSISGGSRPAEVAMLSQRSETPTAPIIAIETPGLEPKPLRIHQQAKEGQAQPPPVASPGRADGKSVSNMSEALSRREDHEDKALAPLDTNRKGNKDGGWKPPAAASNGNPSFALTAATPTQEQLKNFSPPPRKPPPAPLNLNKQNRTSGHLHQVGPDEHSDSEYDDVLEVDEIPAFDRGRRKTREEDDRIREYQAQKEQEARSRSKKEKSLKSSSVKAAVGGSSGDAKSQSQTRPEVQPKRQPQPQNLPTEPLRSPPALKQIFAVSPPSDPGRGPSPSNSLVSVLNAPSNVPSSTPSRQLSADSRRLASPMLSPGLPASPRPMSPGLPASPRPMSPGLPTSPRPIDRPLQSPGLSPRPQNIAAPLSPRAPKYPIPLPPSTDTSTVAALNTELQPNQPLQPVRRSPEPPTGGAPATATAATAAATEGSDVYRGLVSEEYPNLLLPPNALPSIDVKVASSRLKPSRASVIVGKPKASDEESVFTLSISARSDGRELWRVEKDLMSLPLLDQQLKRGSEFSARLPDRNLFSGHAPARIDARRVALNQYFDAVLNTPLDANTALLVCQFFSADALAPGDSPVPKEATAGETSFLLADGKPKKEGYLTKRGKNFGGWKARYFVLDGPVVRYYEAPAGPHLGSIRLHNAQIGKQSPQANSSPSRGGVDDADNQFRHAFLILEPKKKDSSSLVRHVLCAESDQERDDWVVALMHYVDDNSEDEEQQQQPPTSPKEHQSAMTAVLQATSKITGSGNKRERQGKDSPDPDNGVDTLRGVSYQNTVQAEAPVRGPDTMRSEATPSPPGAQAASSQTFGSNGQYAQTPQVVQISAPKNAVVIEDVGAWGNKAARPAQIMDKKEAKKRNIFGFKTRSSSDSNIQGQAEGGAGAPPGTPRPQQLQQQQQQQQQQQGQRQNHNGPTRAVFGAPLAEATEFSRPAGIDVYLPAVVYRCIEYLGAKNASAEEGIFRLSGSNVVIKSLRERFNTQGDVDFFAEGQYYDVHAVASLLKLYLRELPTTVLTRELHLEFLHVLEFDEKEKKVYALKGLVHRLPRANYSLLRALSAFLITIVNNSDVNKMTVRNVGIVFAPTLNIPAPVFSLFLGEFDDIFGSESGEPSPAAAATFVVESTIAAAQPSPDDIRSPRRQMFQNLPTPAYNQTSFPQSSSSSSSTNHRASQLPVQGQGQGQGQAGGRIPYDTGFIPMQPSYEQSMFAQQHNYAANLRQPGPQAAPSSSSAGGEYGSLNGALMQSDKRELKARRRESSMLMGNPAYRNSAMPKLSESPNLVEDDSAFG